MHYLDKYNEWLNSNVIDDKTRDELLTLNQEEKESSFYKDLEFGTAGIRGIMGAGTNRMNKYTVAKITEGLANFILKKNYKNPSVVIAYDSRKNSQLFAFIAAIVFNKKNIKTYIFKTLMPTPVLAYASLILKTSSAINITSSHNSKEYNGYKLYNCDGYQYVNPDDEEIMEEINKINTYQNINTNEIPYMINKGLFNYVDDDIVKGFVFETSKLIKKRYDNERSLKIVYTPLHGTGSRVMGEVFGAVGFTNVFNVLEQRYPDPNFTTTPYPNPEDISVFKIGKEVAIKKDADIIVAHDPDADRVGIMIKKSPGEYTLLSGNQVGVLIGHYILQNADSLRNAVIMRSIVTTKMIDAIAEDYGVELEEVYTGTKHIGEKMAEYDCTGEKKYLYGFEESIGYLIGTYARDKNAFSASLIICEICEILSDHGYTILEHLNWLYEKYGYYKDTTISQDYLGISGMAKMNQAMDYLRDNPPPQIAKQNIIKIEDFLKGQIFNYRDGTQDYIKLAPSNVLRYTLEDGSWFAIRPSGTEPKIKVYMQSIADNETDAFDKLVQIEKSVLKLI